MGSTLRAAPMNFTPMDFYAIGVFFVSNFAHAITEERVVAAFFDLLIHKEIKVVTLNINRRVLLK